MAVTDEVFVQAWQEHGTAALVRDALGMSDLRSVYRRRRKIEERAGVRLESRHPAAEEWATTRLADIALSIVDGTAVVFSDAHFWPGVASPSFGVLLQVLDRIRPDYVIANGDLFDGAQISRHPVGGWGKTPTVKEEIQAVDDALYEIEVAAPAAARIWTRGNHDNRIDARLASSAGEFAGVEGFSLADQFPRWQHVMSCMINGDVMIKHRWHGGIHAAYNNTVKSGVTMVTGHTHTLEARAWSDYRGVRYGIQTGTLADVNGPQFDYCENTARNWQSGFAVLTWHDGKLMPPELVHVSGGVALFRGELVRA